VENSLRFSFSVFSLASSEVANNFASKLRFMSLFIGQPALLLPVTTFSGPLAVISNPGDTSLTR
jgi:hypothetical protein